MAHLAAFLYPLLSALSTGTLIRVGNAIVKCYDASDNPTAGFYASTYLVSWDLCIA